MEEEKKQLPALAKNYSTGVFEITNFEELKAAINTELEKYRGIGVTEENYDTAKEKRANLNSVKKAFNDERIRLEKEYLSYFQKGKDQVNELIKMIDEVCTDIDNGIKAVEEERKTSKKNECVELFNSIENPHQIPFEAVFNEKWLNKGTTIKAVEKEIVAFFEKVDGELNTLDTLYDDETRKQDVIDLYLKSYDLQSAIQEEKRNYEFNHRRPTGTAPTAPAPSPKTDEPVEEFVLTISGTKTQLFEVRDFLKAKGLTFKFERK